MREAVPVRLGDRSYDVFVGSGVRTSLAEVIRRLGAASAGGKTAVNLPEGRNLVGMFWQSSAVDDVGAGTADAAPA